MMHVKRDDKYIGDLIRNNLERGDEVCVKTETGLYMNREVTDVQSPEAHDREVLIGDPDGPHLYLVVDTREVDNDGVGTTTEWNAYAYSLKEGDAADLSSLTKDRGSIEAIAKMGESNAPDMTLAEVIEEAPDDIVDDPYAEYEEMVEQYEEAKREMGRLLDLAEKVVENEITMSEYEDRVAALITRKGGTLVMDKL